MQGLHRFWWAKETAQRRQLLAWVVGGAVAAKEPGRLIRAASRVGGRARRCCGSRHARRSRGRGCGRGLRDRPGGRLAVSGHAAAGRGRGGCS